MKTLEKREINGEQLRAIVGQLGDYCRGQFPNKSCYVHGLGGQTKSTYSELSKVAGVSVRLTYSDLPPALFLLRFITSHAGVVQVLDASRFGETFDTISDSGLTYVYIFNSDRDKDFIEFIANRNTPNEIETWFENVKEGLLYILASDSDFMDWLIIGDAVPVSEAALFEKLWQEGA